MNLYISKYLKTVLIRGLWTASLSSPSILYVTHLDTVFIMYVHILA